MISEFRLVVEVGLMEGHIGKDGLSLLPVTLCENRQDRSYAELAAEFGTLVRTGSAVTNRL